MSQPDYGPSQYPPAPQVQQPYQPYTGYPPAAPQQAYSLEYLQGLKFKETSLIFGIVGLFVLGVVFGPLAIINANKAESLGHRATAGKVLGWIATAMAGLGVLFVVGLYIFAGLMTASGMT